MKTGGWLIFSFFPFLSRHAHLPALTTMSLLRILLPLASLSIAAAACSGQISPVLVSPDGGAEDAGPSPDATPTPPVDGGSPDGNACPSDQKLYYEAPGCGVYAVATCGNTPPPCAEDFCGCDGRTAIGCGVVATPFAYKGACVDGGAEADTCTPAGGSCGPISNCDRGEGQLSGSSYSCGIGAPGTKTCCFKPGTPCGDAADFDCCRPGGGASRPVCQVANGTLACLSGTMAPIGTCP